MERSIRVQAFVLSHMNYGETDRFVNLLTPDRGKISALARGVRKMTSRKSGHLEPFTLITAQLARGSGPSWVVDQVNTLEWFPNLECKLETTCHAAYVAELAERFASEDTANPSLFTLTVETIRRLAALEDPFPALRYFDFRLLEIAGYRPQLQTCVYCNRPIQPVPQYFSNAAGGVVCPNCIARENTPTAISMRSLKYFRYYQRRPFQEAAAAGWPADIRKESESILTNYLTYLSERKINSQAFLNSIR